MGNRQKLIYEYIKGYLAEHSYSPTIREIAYGVGLNSPATVHGHLESMRRKGYIDFIDQRSRTLHILR
ncbi:MULTISPECIES: LexA family protein [unclassified Psychrobacillus]|uniref:LexA family protein n=1 Tax=unclassified Psychrobacillus TaxID=2636677 RepID=UPI0030F8DFAE